MHLARLLGIHFLEPDVCWLGVKLPPYLGKAPVLLHEAGELETDDILSLYRSGFTVRM
jgi:hypothetical protein